MCSISPGLNHWRNWLPPTYYCSHALAPLMCITDTMPKSVISAEPSEDGVTVLITKSHVIVDDQPIIDVPANATHGASVIDKRGGPNDLYITKLGQAAKTWRDRDKQLRVAQGRDSLSSEATIIADKDTPYRLIVEVLYTLGQSEFGEYHLMVIQGAAL